MDFNDFGDLFEDDDELSQIKRELEESALARQLQIEDAQYTVNTIREFGLRMWFKACRFTDVKEAVGILLWCEDVLKADDVEDYEACALLRDQREWLAERGNQIEMERQPERG